MHQDEGGLQLARRLGMVLGGAGEDPRGVQQERRRLAYAGIVSIAVALTSHGELAGDPDVLTSGLPARLRDGGATDKLIDEAIFATLDSLPKQRRRDFDGVSIAIERAVRSSLQVAWGKRPQVHVLIVPV